MFTPILSPAIWLRLDPTTRDELKKIFNIPKTGGIEVINNSLVSDGITADDLRAITIEKMQEYLNETEEQDFFKLFEYTVNKIEYVPEVIVEQVIVTEEIPQSIPPELKEQIKQVRENITNAKPNANVKAKTTKSK